MLRHILRVKTAVIFAVLALACHALAEDPPADSIPIRLDFSKTQGLNTFYSSDIIPDNAAQQSINVEFKINELSTRRGSTEYVDLNAAETKTFSRDILLFVSTTNTQYFFIRNGNKLHELPYQTGINDWKVGTFTKQLEMFAAERRLYVVSEDSGVVRYDETAGPNTQFTATNIPQSPSGHCSQVHLDTVWVSCASSASLANTIFYSSGTSNADQWDPSDYIDILTQKNDEGVTALGAPLFGNMPIYTRNTTNILTGTQFPDNTGAGDLKVKNISDSVGCIHHRTVRNMKDRQYFFSNGENGTSPGIWLLNGVNVKEVTKPIRNFFIDTVDTSTRVLPTAFIYKDEYCLSVATRGGQITTTMVCVEDTNQGYKIRYSTGINVDGFTSYNGNGFVILSNLETQNATIMNWDSGYVDGVNLSTKPITWRYKTKDYNFGTVAAQNPAMQNLGVRKKAPNRAYISFQNRVGTFTVTANYDFGKSSQTWQINMSTTYGLNNWNNRSDMSTVEFSSTVVNRLNFDTKKKFTYVNFEYSGDWPASIKNMDFYFQPDTLP